METLGELLGHPSFFAPAALMLYFALLPALLVWSVWWWLPLVLYLGAAVFYAGQRAVESRRPEYVVVLPPLFLWIHLAYGLGFIGRFLRAGWHR
jgi:hypothetical protein